MMRLVSSGVAAIALLLGGCVTTKHEGPSYSPATGQQAEVSEEKILATIRPGQVPDIKTDEAGLRMSYDKAEADFKTSGGLIRDPDLNRYVKDLVCKIAGPYCGDVRVYIIRAPYFNATMGPNGAMQIWSGLLLRVRNEAQLVAVLGHEIGHYLRQHSLQRMRNTLNTTNALAFFKLAAAGAGVGIVGELGSIVAMAQLTAFSRDQEREADRFGHQFLVEHGYDPLQASKVWEQLIEERDAAGDDEENSQSIFLSTHPLPDERQIALAEMTYGIDSDKKLTKTGAAEYNAAVLPLRRMFLQDELNLRRMDRFEALLDMLIADGRQLAELYYYRGELYRLRAEDGDTGRAFDDYAAAIKAGDPPAELYRSLGMLHHKRDEKAEAKSNFDLYLKAKPDAEDAELIRYMIGTLS